MAKKEGKKEGRRKEEGRKKRCSVAATLEYRYAFLHPIKANHKRK